MTNQLTYKPTYRPTCFLTDSAFRSFCGLVILEKRGFDYLIKGISPISGLMITNHKTRVSSNPFPCFLVISPCFAPFFSPFFSLFFNVSIIFVPVFFSYPVLLMIFHIFSRFFQVSPASPWWFLHVFPEILQVFPEILQISWGFPPWLRPTAPGEVRSNGSKRTAFWCRTSIWMRLRGFLTVVSHDS